MASSSKELLDCRSNSPKHSLIESLLLIKEEDSLPKTQQRRHHGPLTSAVPTSQVLRKVENFLGILGKANEKLELEAQENPCSKFDIEVLDGNEQEYIEMDLLLGIADLHTPEAVVAAESTMGSFQLSKSFPDSSSDTEDGSEEDTNDDEVSNDIILYQDKLQKLKSDKTSAKNKPNKRKKIVVLN